MTSSVTKTMNRSLKCYVMLSLFILTWVNANGSNPISEDFDVRPEETGNESERDLYPQASSTGLCRECSCPREPECEPGVSLVLDGCGCCKTCAKQLGDQCNRRDICDIHRGLHCNMTTGRCAAKPGRNCFVSGKWYKNGELFSPSCRLACNCIDGYFGCVSKCKPAPPGCQHPKLVRTADNCCGKWRCMSRPSDFVSGKKDTIELRGKGSCIVQTTEWSACSKTCGFGLSERVTNDNDNCKLTKESRLCIIRPCKVPAQPRKGKRSCRRTMRHKKRVQFKLSECLATKTLRPRYCGMCRHANKCCKPENTKTIEIEFRCDAGLDRSGDSRPGSSEGYIMKRKMMWIQSCVCGDYCPNNENEIFSNSFRGLGSDIWRTT